MEKGYSQALENLVYYALKFLQEDARKIAYNDDFSKDNIFGNDEKWEQLDEIMEIIAETYDVSIDEVAETFEILLEYEILDIINKGVKKC